MTTQQHHHQLSAQCPACGLDELVPIHLCREPAGTWIQVDIPGPLADPAPDSPQGAFDVQLDTCPVCFGGWFDPGELDALAGEHEALEAVLEGEPQPTARVCPHGHGPLVEQRLPVLLRSPIDRCLECGGMWLDGPERRKLAKASTTEGQGTARQRMIKRGAIWAVQVLTHLPFEVENPTRGTPWVVFSIIAALVGLFAAQELGYIDTYDYGLVPGRLRRDGDAYTLAAYMFLHGSWPHLLGNAYFLYTFGDNMEHLFGRLRFAMFFAVTGLAAGLIHFLITRRTATPVVGASGAIAGVLAAYLWAFPRQRLFQVVLWIQLKIPVWVYLCVWVGFHVVMGFFGTGKGAEGVAWFAHLGGFLVGLGLTPLLLRWRRRDIARRVAVPALA